MPFSILNFLLCTFLYKLEESILSVASFTECRYSKNLCIYGRNGHACLGLTKDATRLEIHSTK